MERGRCGASVLPQFNVSQAWHPLRRSHVATRPTMLCPTPPPWHGFATRRDWAFDFHKLSTHGTSKLPACATRLPNPIKPAEQAGNTMSQNGGDASKVSSPGRARHQITRSISEISSPIRLHRHQSHRAIKDSDRDTHSPAPAPQSAVAALQARRSFEVSRSEGATPNLSPNASRRTSVLYPSTDEVMQAIKKVLKDNGIAKEVVEEQQLAMARERLVGRPLRLSATEATH